MAFEAESELLKRAVDGGVLDRAKGEAALIVYKQLAQMGASFSFGDFLLDRHLLTQVALEALQGNPDGEIGTVDTVGDYKLLSLIGEGQSGTVFRAMQQTLHRVVAVKILSQTLASDAAALLSLQTEARAIARLNHPNVVHGIDVGSDRGLHYFAMEYVEGGPLSVLLKSQGGCLDEGLALELVGQVAAGLQAAHAAKLLHGDVKPENVLLAGPPFPPPVAQAPTVQSGAAPKHVQTGKFKMPLNQKPQALRAGAPASGIRPGLQGAKSPNPALKPGGAGLMGVYQAKLADLGISRILAGAQAHHASSTGEFSATPAYAPPELIRGTSENDPRSDLYSLGAMLFELLVGHPPYMGATPHEVLQKHLTTPLPNVLLERPNLNPQTAALLKALLAKDPAQRPHSAEAVAGTLQAILRTLHDRPAVPAQKRSLGSSYLLRKRLHGK